MKEILIKDLNKYYVIHSLSEKIKRIGKRYIVSKSYFLSVTKPRHTTKV